MAEPLGQRIRFLGWRSDVEALYAASDLIVLTSDNEGMPVSLIEAASLGVPAVCSNVGSVSEVVIDGETGILTDTEPSAIAAAVSQLLEDGALRAKMGLAAAERARRLFSTDRLVEDTADLYRSFAAGETSLGG
jgi:glycosyltransferase involved in cell wall biosynthesis